MESVPPKWQAGIPWMHLDFAQELRQASRRNVAGTDGGSGLRPQFLSLQLLACHNIS
jgi:hypothetical protein